MRHFSVLIALFLTILSLKPAIGHTISGAAPEGQFEIRIERVYYAMQGHLVDVSIKLNTGAEVFGGFDFLIGFNSSTLTLTNAALGDYLVGCGWEYFTYRNGSNGNCGSGCPTGLVRLIGLAETVNGSAHPDYGCLWGTVGNDIVTLTFYVSSDRTLACTYVPIQFYWMDCNDNSLSSVSGDTLFVNQNIYDSEINQINDPDYGFPGYFGVTDSCLQGDKVYPLRFVVFINGGVDIICSDSIDLPGDINVNGVPYEIADAVMFANYFVAGLTAFDGHVEASITASDVNADGITLSVADLVQLIRVIVGDAPPIPKTIPGENARIAFRGDDVFIATPVDLGAALLIFRVDGEVTPQLHADMNMKYTVSDGELRILIYDIGQRAIPAGNNLLLTVPGAELAKVELASYYGSSIELSMGGEPNLPEVFALQQNVPNPFNPITTISLAVPVETDWTIEILNVTGQTIRKFAGHSYPGDVDVIWDGKDNNGRPVASGIYIYRAAASSFSQSRKMILLK